jgi:hypothetical protein
MTTRHYGQLTLTSLLKSRVKPDAVIHSLRRFVSKPEQWARIRVRSSLNGTKNRGRFRDETKGSDLTLVLDDLFRGLRRVLEFIEHFA